MIGSEVENEFPHSLVFFGCARGLGADFVSSDSPDGAGANGVQLADVSAANSSEGNPPPQTRTPLVVVAALPVSVAACHRFRPAVPFSSRYPAGIDERKSRTGSFD